MWCAMAVRREGGGYDGGLKSFDNSMSLQASEVSEDEMERRDMRSPFTYEAPIELAQAPVDQRKGHYRPVPRQPGETEDIPTEFKRAQRHQLQR